MYACHYPWTIFILFCIYIHIALVILPIFLWLEFLRCCFWTWCSWNFLGIIEFSSNELLLWINVLIKIYVVKIKCPFLLFFPILCIISGISTLISYSIINYCDIGNIKPIMRSNPLFQTSDIQNWINSDLENFLCLIIVDTNYICDKIVLSSKTRRWFNHFALKLSSLCPLSTRSKCKNIILWYKRISHKPISYSIKNRVCVG